ncbi:tRNA (adenine-N1)-methyltransferase, partial [Bifidobacterium animalis subsp. lactis]|nr:tRNA (adenine-N1)-methyltransferase [Bifidobacterium animalis subsp. lactis]
MIVKGGVFVGYVKTTTKMRSMAEAMRESEHWHAQKIQEIMERN